MVGWCHQLDGHEFEQALGVGDRQGSLACCSQWSHKELDTTELLNNNSQKKISESSVSVKKSNPTNQIQSWTIKKAEHRRMMLLNCGVGEDS